MSFLRDLIELALPVAYADEPEEEEEEEVVESTEESTEESSEEASEESTEDSSEEAEESAEAEEGGDDEDGEDDDEDEDDDDEDEDELVDPLETLRSECEKTTACKPFVHHFHECIERVTAEQEEEGYDEKPYKEDCVEEFFHLQHCVNDCVSPRLFAKLK